MKLAILGTNEAREIKWSGDGNEIIGTKPSDLLLRLINEGYEIVIISTREQFFPTDSCWQKLIPPSDVYHPNLDDPENQTGPNNPAMIKLWKEVFDRFKLSYPMSPYTEDNWLYWRWAAKEQGVIVDAFEYWDATFKRNDAQSC